MNVKLIPTIDKNNKVYLLFKYRKNGIMNNKDFLLNSILRRYLTKDMPKYHDIAVNELAKGVNPVFKAEENDDYIALNLEEWLMQDGLTSNVFYFILDLARLEDSYELDSLKDTRNKMITKAVNYIIVNLYRGLSERKDKKDLEENYAEYYLDTLVGPSLALNEIKHKFTVEGLDNYEGLRCIDYLSGTEKIDKTDLFNRIVKIYKERYSLENLDIYIAGDIEKDDTLVDNIKKVVEGYINSINSVDLENEHFPKEDVSLPELSLKDEKNLMGYSVSSYNLPELTYKEEGYDEDRDTAIYSMLVFRNSLEKITSVKELAIQYFIGEILNIITDDEIDIEVDYPNYAEIQNDKPELHIIVKGNEVSNVMEDVVVNKLGNYLNLDSKKLSNAKKVVLKKFRDDGWDIQTILEDNNYTEEDFIRGLKEFSFEELKDYIHNFKHITTVQGKWYTY